MVVAGWFDGTTTEQLTAAAVSRLRAGEGFVLHWWGLTDAAPADRTLARVLELGDRAWKDAERENATPTVDGQDWVVSKAVLAYPISFEDFVALGASERGPSSRSGH